MNKTIAFSNYDSLATDNDGLYTSALVEYLSVNAEGSLELMKNTTEVKIPPTKDAATAMTKVIRAVSPAKA